MPLDHIYGRMCTVPLKTVKDLEVEMDDLRSQNVEFDLERKNATTKLEEFQKLIIVYRGIYNKEITDNTKEIRALINHKDNKHIVNSTLNILEDNRKKYDFFKDLNQATKNILIKQVEDHKKAKGTLENHILKLPKEHFEK